LRETTLDDVVQAVYDLELTLSKVLSAIESLESTVMMTSG